ncbi:hypothetical protein FA15DRAFT_547941, partial [Coprinopsis marcescibilis]
KDDIIDHAAAAYRLELKKPAAHCQGARAIANDFEKLYLESTGAKIHLNHGTVRNRAAGMKSKKDAAMEQGWLLPEEEDIIISHIIQSADQGFPLTHRRLKEDVDRILQGRLGDEFPEEGVGKKWTQWFVAKH